MRILLHTMYFLPDFGSAPILMNELAASLTAAGHEVEVVTTLPRVRSAGLPARLYSRSRGDGFTVKRFWTNATPHPLGRLLAWNIYTAGALANLVSVGRGDLLFLRTPPLQLGVPAFWGRALRGTRTLVNVQDIHPDLAIESGILRNPAGIRFARGLERWVYGLADRIVVISEGFKKNLLVKGVPEPKLEVIPNWVDTDFLKPLPKDNALARKLGLHDKFVIMYSGTISISSNLALERVLEAAKALAPERKVLFVIVGEGLKKGSLRAKASSLGLDNAVFLPFQPYPDLPALLASSDVLLVPLDEQKSQLSVPSKLYNFMAAGRPILGLATEGSEVASVLRTTGGGMSVPPGDLAGFERAVLDLKRSPDARRAAGEKAREFVVQTFAKDLILARFDRTLRDMAR